ncbi:DUF2848 family protein [Metabacillus sp. cB07]|uniref:DUF2848 family protein n=1 Tax=Metabacillus sp. cB07 TaxID=2806989 RepID=UPI001939894F|nr:DUF2848 family protein [Metabacillus sp. cB07]
MELRCEGETIHFQPEHLVVMGFTSRDTRVLKKLFNAMEKIGGQIPETTPVVFPLSADLLTTKEEISVVGSDTNGEVEYLIILSKGEIYIGVGSDHADKQIESQNIHKSKQLCAKHMSEEVWKWSAVKDHWDEIVLESRYIVNGKEELYQRNIAEVMLRPEDIIQSVESDYDHSLLNLECVIFSGSVPTIDGFKYGEHFKYSLHDPVNKEKISSEYSVKIL